MRFFCRLSLIAALVATLSIRAHSQDVYTVRTKDIRATVSPTLWGLFFEDINRGADGGLYAEMVENRSFDFPKPMTAWETWPKSRLRDGIFVVTNQSAENAADPKYMTVSLKEGDTVGLINEGFDEGMAVKKGVPYQMTLRYRQESPGVNVRMFLFNGRNRPIAQTAITLHSFGRDWQDQQMTLVPDDTAIGGKLLVIFEGEGKIDVDRISLFPTDTWKGRPGGLRNDLVQALADLHPGFLRFPGGCIVEGNQLVHRYQWKHTIGPLEDRQMVQSIWADDVPERQTPDYMESFGLGFYEYFQLCEDIGAAPLPIINCGMSCQFDAAEVVPTNELEPYIQDALDLIEFANGDVGTTWGARRVALGHFEPFHLTMLGVGNENWGPQYAERLALFTKRIKDKYPDIRLVNATGYSRNIPVFTYMDSILRARKADIIDEHFYSTPQWFMQNANRYDSYDRSGPKIFVGEYAAQSDRIGSQKNVNNLLTALSEACFMTGIERNADVITMASYAPLFAHVTGWQWTPNLIWFDNSRSYKTPNYYVQQLFAVNKGTAILSLLRNGRPIAGQDSCWASAVLDQTTHDLIIKIVNVSKNRPRIRIDLADARCRGTATVTTLRGELNEQNEMDREVVQPVVSSLIVKGRDIPIIIEQYSLTVLRVPL
ncbi:MAG TPA: alpha-L-arabinofuranosidase C-terminal domain-containing protein [Puia sp.]|jgi:alpha-N-arabinofuranosidase|nr:alpha-L-arabinofuranosidase C-terminal domain-containing protein [Puia sp.]